MELDETSLAENPPGARNSTWPVSMPGRRENLEGAYSAQGAPFIATLLRPPPQIDVTV